MGVENRTPSPSYIRWQVREGLTTCALFYRRCQKARVPGTFSGDVWPLTWWLRSWVMQTTPKSLSWTCKVPLSGIPEPFCLHRQLKQLLGEWLALRFLHADLWYCLLTWIMLCSLSRTLCSCLSCRPLLLSSGWWTWLPSIFSVACAPSISCTTTSSPSVASSTCPESRCVIGQPAFWGPEWPQLMSCFTTVTFGSLLLAHLSLAVSFESG